MKFFRSPCRIQTPSRPVSCNLQAVAMPMIRLRSGGGTILLEPLEDPDDPSPSTKCCPELVMHLDISLGVDCHRPLIVVLEPEWSNDAMFGDGNPGSALHRV